ncbi:cytochrome c1 [Aspergillus ellipticus CBS 707.79]|uniref:quinol--cytochrome-c reductase n=1 Tax=Aspergillus ellipticus CBS 707.79 TaxID=1448320 RepID=A0A319F4H1_9EURO|nr:cytochrome c1 [Aspergillus ellipticus CBS 707.79]
MSFISPIPRLPEVSQLPTLHVEALVKSSGDGIIVRTDLIRDEVTKWLVDKFVVLSIGQKIFSFGGLDESHAQALDAILVVECSGGNLDTGTYRLQQVELDVQAYQLRTKFEQKSSRHSHTPDDSIDNEEDEFNARTLALPSMDLDGLWESLQFDQPIQSKLLSAISRMVSFSMRRLGKWTINWNRLILIWGPPGTGKTSFCRGLSQKLAIRLGKHYPRSKLFEINAYSLGSKFFGESGKLVSRMFENIELLLEEEEDTFVCVFIDEIETLAPRRDRALRGNEPFDAIRAVNALLTGLDKLKEHPNVIVVCTSNLITALDQAFLDRVDIKQHIPQLSTRPIYKIYKDCLEELGRHGIIEGTFFDVVQVTPNDPLQYVEQPAEQLILPPFDEMIMHYKAFPDAAPKLLADAVFESVGLSGRTIRRLPALSLVLYNNSARCDVRTAIQALRVAIASETQVKAEAMAEGHSGATTDQRPIRAQGLICGSGWGCGMETARSFVPFGGVARQSLSKASTRASSSTAGAESANSPFHLTLAASAATAVALGSAAYLYGQEAFAMTPAEEGLHPTAYPWEHAKWNKTFDHQALRRGFQVYREVCASCHSLTRVPWRSFVGVMHTVDEMKAMAEENEYDTEPNDQGEIEKRPGKLSDYIPAPYKNEEAARAANGGALPPDLSLIVKGRHGGCNYIFSLLTGYPDEPPAGATVQEGMNFNPYFPGTAIAMGRVLFDGVVEYEDGTPATTSQMAKDVVEFLNWAAEPEMDDRKKMGVKAITLLTGLFAVSVWVKRYKWSPIKTRKIVYSPPVPRR